MVDVAYRQVYWHSGSEIPTERRFAVMNPPSLGWTEVFIVKHESGECILFDPFTFYSVSVPEDCAEVSYSREPHIQPNMVQVLNIIETRMPMIKKMAGRDLKTAGVVLEAYGRKAPDLNKRGCKPCGSELIKKVRSKGKRGKFVKFIVDGNFKVDVMRLAEHMDMTRGNVLTYLYLLNRDHGLGYDVEDDTVRLILPPGCESPF